MDNLFGANSTSRAMVTSFLRLLQQTQCHTKLSRTPLNESSARRRDLYATTHNTSIRLTSSDNDVSRCQPAVSLRYFTYLLRFYVLKHLVSVSEQTVTQSNVRIKNSAKDNLRDYKIRCDFLTTFNISKVRSDVCYEVPVEWEVSQWRIHKHGLCYWTGNFLYHDMEVWRKTHTQLHCITSCPFPWSWLFH
jgi:hypothetical protein